MRYLSRKEEMVLLIIWRLGDNAYGVPIRDEIIRISKKYWSIGAIHDVLDRLTRNGYVTKKTGESMKKRGVTINTMVTTGNAAEEILKAADELKVELIAMSTHGRSGLRRLAFGSITDKVLHGASIPVLMVRAPEGTVNE